MASRGTAILAVSLLASMSCDDGENSPASPRRVQAFTFVGRDLIVVEESTSHPTPRGNPPSREDPDGRVVRYAGDTQGEPSVLVDGLTLSPSTNSAVAVIGNRALMRSGCQVWRFGLDNGDRQLIPCLGELQASGPGWVTDGTAIYAEMKAPNTATGEGAYYIGKVDADGNPEPLAGRVFGEDLAIDKGLLYFSGACPRLEASCPEAGVYRATLTGMDVVQVARLDQARTSVDLAQRKVDRVAVFGEQIYFTTASSWSRPTCAVHVATVGRDEPAKDLLIVDDGQCEIAATDDGVVACGDSEVRHVNASTGTVRTLASTKHCNDLQWSDGFTAWIDDDRLLHSVTTR